MNPTVYHVFEKIFLTLRHLLKQLGLFYGLGLFILAFVLMGFAHLASEVLEGEFNQLNEEVLILLHQHATPALDMIAITLSALGGGLGIMILTGVMSVLMLYHRRYLDVAVFLIVMMGSGFLITILKESFHLPRPDLFPSFVQKIGYSFPSGHSTASVCFYEYLSYLWIEAKPQVKTRWCLASLFLFFPLGVMWSRMYLGVHWFTDVVAGALVATGWVSLCLILRGVYLRRR